MSLAHLSLLKPGITAARCPGAVVLVDSCLSKKSISRVRFASGYARIWRLQSQPARIWSRSARTSSTVKVQVLPQGAIALEPLENDVDKKPEYPTVVQQARNNMMKFDGCVLLTRVGSFYELYFEQAEQFGPLLNLKVAQKRTNAGPVPMAGFPFMQLDRILKVLVQDNEQHVAISEEILPTASERVRSGGLMFDRKVTRIITPGTLIDEHFLDPSKNNFLLAVHVEESFHQQPSRTSQGQETAAIVGLAWLDLSTGDFFTQKTDLRSMPAAIARISPREVILDKRLENPTSSDAFSKLKENRCILTHRYASQKVASMSTWTPFLERSLPAGEELLFTAEEVAAGSILLDYVGEQLQGQNLKLQPPVRREPIENMMIESSSMRALEIKETLRDGHFKGSLLHTMKQTVTNSGARLLSDWLTAPSTSLTVINNRLDLVTYLLERDALREEIVHLLRTSYDSQRIVQKFSLGRGDADDLISLVKTINATEQIASIIRQSSLQSGNEGQSTPDDLQNAMSLLLARIDLVDPLALATAIDEAIDETGLTKRHILEEREVAGIASMAQEVLSAEGESVSPIVARAGAGKNRSIQSANGKKDEISDEDVWVMRKTASKILTQLHNDLEQLRSEKAELEESLRKEHGTGTLTLRWTPGLGHICHIKGKDTKASLSSFTKARSVSASKSTRSFELPEWTKLGNRIDQTRLQIKAEEQRVFLALRDKVIMNIVKLRRNAAVLDELDVVCSFARSAQEQDLSRPILNHGRGHRILGGRHATVERGLEEQGRSFTTNDCFVGEEGRIWLITGPNMAGKSTFLRQNALISIMAQVGSFVPAQYAEIGIVDQIFSRLGSADNLYHDQSTFMVEMLETAAILKQATPRSFVIMDEVGRGTTPEDGIAVSYACLHHLYHVNKCRALFATHFHALADMAGSMNDIAYHCTDVEDSEKSFSYVHRLRKGVNRNSHALKVAGLAGIPASAISTAEGILRSGGTKR